MAPTPPDNSRAALHHILVVDDDADMRDYLRSCLVACYGAAAVVVTEAADGLEALEAALAQAPDLIITDLVMPRLDGYGLCRAIRAEGQLQTVPILILSGQDGAPPSTDEGDAIAFMPKLFNASTLRSHIEPLLR